MIDILEMAAANPVIPVVKIRDPEDAPALARALYEGGLCCMEITFRTEGADQAIANVAREVPEMLVGAGTVINEAQVDQAVKAGAQFIVSPGLSERVMLRCRELDVACLPGCVTPGEIMRAISLGAEVVKFFPAETNGGVKAIRALAAPFSGIRFIPTGGISPENLGDYLSLSCIAACGGSWMVQEEDLRTKNFASIREKSRKAAECAGRYGR